MTQEEKQILLKDLCARIPYGVMCKTEEGNGKLISIECSYGEDLAYVDFGNAEAEECDLNDGDMVKPYLRPMSNMTKEEVKEIQKINWQFWKPKNDSDECFVGDADDGYCSVSQMAHIINYLNAHHFDYLGLIPMGLALEAPEDMYKTEQP